MIEISDQARCTGCGACACICPQHAVSMALDAEGFLYPVVDRAQCCECGLCDRVCHMRKSDADLFRGEKSAAPSVHAAFLRDAALLNEVSSGGAFEAMAQQVIADGGVVYGVEMVGLDKVYHQRAETVVGCAAFRRSKYLESDTGTSYRQVKNDLAAGRLVLFSGTGCQIAGLYAYLQADAENLITCDVVCHSIPSKNVFLGYIAELEKRIHSFATSINFRGKHFGWRKNQTVITFSDGNALCEPSAKNAFHSGYLAGLYSRPSCATCRYACLPRIADITLADYWQYRGPLLSENPDGGISLIVCSTKKGEALLHKLGPRLKLEASTLSSAMASCKHLTQVPEASPFREAFFRNFSRSGFASARRNAERKLLAQRLYESGRQTLARLRRRESGRREARLEERE